MTMHLRTGISIPVGPTRVYVSPSFTPNRPAVQRPAHQPAPNTLPRPTAAQLAAATRRPRKTIPTPTTPQMAARAIAAHERSIAAIKRQQAAQTPVATWPTRPVHLAPRPATSTTYRAARPTGFYACVALSMVLGTALLLILGVMAMHTTPRGVAGTVTITGVSAPANAAAHTTKAAAAPVRGAQK